MIKRFNDLKEFAKGTDKGIDIAKAHEFLKAFKDIDSFLDYFKFEDLNSKFEIEFDKPISENEFANLSFDKAQVAFESLSKQNFNEFEATNERNWLYLNINLVKQNIIKPSFFGFASNRSSTGAENIKKALDCKDQEIIKDILRIIARNMYGATLGLRGKKGIYQDISLAKAWWRFYLAKEISQNTNLNLEQIYKYFVAQKSNYNELIMRMSGGLTIIANPNTRDALILFLLEQNEKITGDKLKQMIKKIGIESAWRLIGGLNLKENLQIIKEFAK